MARLLITGGAGFIGSHTCVVLLEAGHNLLVLDNFSNSSPVALERLKSILNLNDRDSASRLQVFQGDVRDIDLLEKIFEKSELQSSPIEAVIHFAGLKAVEESVHDPLGYWDVNVSGSRTLLEVMDKHDCKTLVFSSSATLYGYPDIVPIPESAPINPINPYGASKAAVEMMLADVAGCLKDRGIKQASTTGWRIARLRYFNPVGAHPSGCIGEDPNGVPNNLFPYVSQVAIGRRGTLQVFGSDWPTSDGTGIRDYIHVMDLAEGHKCALDALVGSGPQLLTLNLGSGVGSSVLEVIRAFETASGREVPYKIVERRPGDAAITVADPTLAYKCLGWRTRRGLNEICRDGWAWQFANPNGYKGEVA